ncbi:MAG: glycerol acyltransferase, partial [Leptothrix sp. (in: b-proteobacteria)]
VLGRVAVQAVPATPPTDPGLRIQFNPFTETVRNLALAHRDPAVFRALIGISWMWFFGAVFLAQFPSFAKDVLHGDERVASLLLALFSVGIGVGALLCERLSRQQVEIGIVPFGALGMTLFSVDLYLATQALVAPADGVAQGVSRFIAQPAHWRVMADLMLLALSAGLYSVPLYALIQLRSPVRQRARVIAANNILNALFMIASALIAGVLLGAGVSVGGVFLATGLANALVTGTLFLLAPDYLRRCAGLVGALRHGMIRPP